ncbi:tetratricopeptide repeat protein [Gelidibacter maritimus]|uniref:Cardiolipin synthase N-terminal domain-containing protein n=1 Tax=Gelidibacter maritimus TaxID=2761487 RepID=A0A7W2R4K2_9FLAO|nr:tetratricopeptide repeat protein [Gelidibacter maritimus]MBA6153986.1 hypothetical protein [Gelidibacter maritimus]
MYFYFIIAFQAFCIYHLFKNRKSFYWIFAIIFLPLVGCVAYLVTQVPKRNDSEKIQENFKKRINPSNKVKAMQQKLEFADTYLNRVNLADAYLEANDYSAAIEHYTIALEDKTQNDFFVKEHLIKSYYNINDYDQVIAHSDGLESHNEFEKSEVPFLYGMALAEMGRTDEAIALLRMIDRPYSNYNERVAFAKLMLRIDKTADAKEILEELSVEMQNMTAPNQRIYKETILEVEKLRKNL